MSVTMQEYRQSNPTQACLDMDNFDDSPGTLCPLCKRSSKWYYRYYEPSSALDSQYRCTLHPISPTPGPDHLPDYRKISQIY